MNSFLKLERKWEELLQKLQFNQVDSSLCHLGRHLSSGFAGLGTAAVLLFPSSSGMHWWCFEKIENW